MSSGSDDVEVAKYERDVTAIIAATTATTVTIIAIVICSGILYYYRCVKFARVIHPNDVKNETEKNTGTTNGIDSPGDKCKTPDNISVTHEQDKGHYSDEKTIVQTKISSPYNNMVSETEELFIVEREYNKLQDLITPPEKVLLLYDEGNMTQFYEELEKIYGSLSLEHEHFTHSKNNIRLAYDHTWRRKVSKRRRKRKRSLDQQSESADQVNVDGNGTVLPELKESIRLLLNRSDNTITVCEEISQPDHGPKRGFLEMIVSDIAEEEGIHENQTKERKEGIGVNHIADIKTEQELIEDQVKTYSQTTYDYNKDGTSFLIESLSLDSFDVADESNDDKKEHSCTSESSPVRDGTASRIVEGFVALKEIDIGEASDNGRDELHK